MHASHLQSRRVGITWANLSSLYMISFELALGITDGRNLRKREERDGEREWLTDGQTNCAAVALSSSSSAARFMPSRQTDSCCRATESHSFQQSSEEK